MKRSEFLKNTSLCAIAVTASGNIRFNGRFYEGDCETTTDILGPFYRPGSPLRRTLRIPGQKGTPVELAGVIKHKDCRTPYKNAKIELWHCDADGIYDNSSDEFRYRGTTFSDEQGLYSFQTVLPVPYDNGGGFRPAHFHLMVSANSYQPLVTQIYFTGDPYIPDDVFASSATAQKRILSPVTLDDGSKKIQFDIVLAEKLYVEPAMLDKLAGTYVDEQNKNIRIQFFKKDKSLWMKNEVYGINFEYIGDNTFQYPGQSVKWTIQFVILANGSVKGISVQENLKTGKKEVHTGIKLD
jgi:catechol 1,2-dioxygenase